jgi:hypothetical protein
MTSSVFCHKPDRIERVDVVVMEQSTVDDLPHIQPRPKGDEVPLSDDSDSAL